MTCRPPDALTPPVKMDTRRGRAGFSRGWRHSSPGPVWRFFHLAAGAGPAPAPPESSGQLPRDRGQTPGLPPRGVRPRWALAFEQRPLAPRLRVRHATPFRSTCGTSLREAGPGAGDAEFAGADGAAAPGRRNGGPALRRPSPRLAGGSPVSLTSHHRRHRRPGIGLVPSGTVERGNSPCSTLPTRQRELDEVDDRLEALARAEPGASDPACSSASSAAAEPGGSRSSAAAQASRALAVPSSASSARRRVPRAKSGKRSRRRVDLDVGAQADPRCLRPPRAHSRF